MKTSSLVLTLSAALFLAACGGQDGTVTFTATGMHFIRDEVRARAGQEVALRLVNKDSYPHSFDLDEFDLHFPLAANATLDISFTAGQSGTYTFYCCAPGHTAAGMVGTLIIEPD